MNLMSFTSLFVRWRSTSVSVAAALGAGSQCNGYDGQPNGRNWVDAWNYD
jgi:hypothetical protein